ncbi:hypothetical protein [Lentilactobacillus diolivorans]|nr:hypothetical protein [Lentilactobacillus diolivorans]
MDFCRSSENRKYRGKSERASILWRHVKLLPEFKRYTAKLVNQFSD